MNTQYGLLEPEWSCGPITPTSLVEMLVTCDREVGSGRGGGVEGVERRSRNRQYSLRDTNSIAAFQRGLNTFLVRQEFANAL